MDEPQIHQPGVPQEEIAEVLSPGVVLLEATGEVRFADLKALELLGCADGFELDRLWGELKPRLESAGLRWDGAGGGAPRAVLGLPVTIGAVTEDGGSAERRLLFDLRRDPQSGGVLLVRDVETLEGLAADLHLTSQMRSVSGISPAVAHDLRAPINTMVFNLEILKDSIASGRVAEPAGQERLLRYVKVLGEELTRLHRELEVFLAYISPRSDRTETLDLGQLAGELAALMVGPARKQLVQVKPELGREPVLVEGNRYLLRQALLHLAVAVLAGTPKRGELHLHLAKADGRGRLRFWGAAGPESPAEAAGEEEPPAPGFSLRVSPEGSLAQLWVARSILASHGGEVREAGPAGSTAAGAGPAYEVELAVSENTGFGKE